MDPTQAAALASIQTAIQQTAALIAEITVNPMPDYSVQGVSYSWSGYLSMLTERMEKLQEAMIALSGPYQICTQAVS